MTGKPSCLGGDEETATPQTRPQREEERVAEISPERARRLAELGIGLLLDVREDWEREVEGPCPGSQPFPLFAVKTALGHRLTPEEQEALDATPEEAARRGAAALAELDRLVQRLEDPLLFCLCNRGERSRSAAALLRAEGWGDAYSVEGGLRAFRGTTPPSRDCDTRPLAVPSRRAN